MPIQVSVSGLLMAFGSHAADEKIFEAIGVSMIYNKTTPFELAQKNLQKSRLKLLLTYPLDRFRNYFWVKT